MNEPLTLTSADGLPGEARRAIRLAGLAGLTMTTIAVVGGAIGERLPATVLIVIGLAAFFAHLRPRHRVAIACASGLIALALVNPVFSVYFTGLVAALAWARRRIGLFAVVLVTGAMVLPKTAFSMLYHRPGWWNWINDPSLTIALLVGALWIRTRWASRGGRAAPTSPLDFALAYFFPSHATNPMPYAPALLAAPAAVDERAILRLLGWFLVKGLALVGLRTLGRPGFLNSVVAAEIAASGWLDLWGLVIGSYLETYLALATTADIPVLMGRLFGFPLPDPFRFSLLAWNPVELWRRWGIYNRQVLLQLVYVPLGGARRKYTNVVLTFVASALLLHSGWFGSKYWLVGAAGWRDQTIYFLVQALAVCGCLLVWDYTANARDRRAVPKLSLGLVAGVLMTQSWSALAHVIVLAPQIELADRARLIRRCLGIG